MAPLKYHRPPGPSTPEAPYAWSSATGARRAPTARCLRFPLRSRSARRRLPHRKRKRKDRPLAYRAHDRHLASVELHEPPCKREPETGPLVLPRQVGTHLAERLEDLRLVLGRDPGPRVAHRYFDYGVLQDGLDVNPPALLRELDRVGEEVEYHLSNLALVGDEIVEAFVHRQAECDAVAGRTLAQKGQCALQRGRKVEGSQLQLHAPGLDLGQIQDVVD